MAIQHSGDRRRRWRSRTEPWRCMRSSSIGALRSVAGRLLALPREATDPKSAPELGRLGLNGPRITFRTLPARLQRVASPDRPLDCLRQLGRGAVIWTRATASTGGHGPPASPHQSQARAADDTLPLPPLGPRHATETSWSDPKGGRAWPSKAGSKIFLLDMANPRGICPPEMGVKTPLPSAIRCSIHVCARPIRCSPGH
jgi:hypothetical protein